MPRSPHLIDRRIAIQSADATSRIDSKVNA